MKIFLAGATGVIGRSLAPMLVRSGHTVVGLTRRPDSAETLRAIGVEPAIGDALDRDGLARLVAAARPDAMIHELTDIPRALNVRRYAAEFAGNDRIRSEGTDNLVRAALAAGAKRIVAQSIAFAYAPEAATAIRTEDDPLYDDAPEPFRRSVAALRTLERLVTATPGIDGIVLRYGIFYGPGTGYARDGQWAEEVRRRRFPIAGRGQAVASFIHVDDAAAATVAALERGRPGIYNIVDDEPATQSEWLMHFARSLGAPPPRRMPAVLVRLLAGPVAALLATRTVGASNAKAKRELGWSPRHPSWRQGLGQ